MREDEGPSSGGADPHFSQQCTGSMGMACHLHMYLHTLSNGKQHVQTGLSAHLESWR